MAHSLEVRVPLLSQKVVEFVTELPIEYKIHGTATKRIIKDAFKDLIPPEIITRKKMGFEVPVGEFLRNELRDMYNDTVSAASLGDLGLNPQTAQRIYDEHKAQKKDHSQLLWSLMVLCGWHNRRNHSTR
jgi:asparagine synthase (glutamine-hydrolysing)